MKFVHIADLHFDSPFRTLNRIENLSNIRRLEQREVLKKVIEYIKENNIKYLFISGDLYEHEYIKLSTIEYMNNLFKQIPETRIFITPGNHDPYLINSYYAKYSWNNNVYIFNGNVAKVECDECDIYGVGFDDFYCKDSKIDNIKIQNREKINILITHGSLDASKKDDNDYLSYQPIKTSKLKELNFDYVALGHIHKNNYINGNRAIYPGSLISFGFDELGKHGMIVGELSKETINLEFKEIDSREYIEKEIETSNILSIEELIEVINNIKMESNNLYKIILVGSRNFEIDINNINKLIKNDNILKIKDNTKIKYDLEKLSNSYDLRGIFIKLMLDKLKKEETSKSAEMTSREKEKASEDIENEEASKDNIEMTLDNIERVKTSELLDNLELNNENYTKEIIYKAIEFGLEALEG